MCGIAGIISISDSLSDGAQETVREMNEVLIHRGPDAEGYFHDEHCALAMRRLSIIDLPGGNQPAWNEVNNVAVFFNGEIYNYREIRESLLKNGHQFRSQSDTEVLAHLYEEYKEGMVSRLKGMFAFCIYDIAKRVFFFARDRFGEKPLYFHVGNNELSFSSEIRSLLRNRRIERKLNKEALPYYFRTSLIPEPMTLLEGVESLPAGNWMKIEAGSVKVQSYFEIDYSTESDVQTKEQAVETIRPMLSNAVLRQMGSDVPLGAFLSGGIDSSTMVALLQENSMKQIQTFNVKFENTEYDESPVAKKVAEYCGTDHHEIVLPNMAFDPDDFWRIIDHVGMPFRDSSAIPTHMISREIGKHVKVAISGDGGDEVFAGYAVFDWYQKVISAKRLPASVRQIALAGLAAARKVSPGSNSLRQLARGLETSMLPNAVIPISLSQLNRESEINALLNDPQDFSLPLLSAWLENSDHWSDLRKIMYYRMKHTLTSNMLVKVDRMSMANSIEVRAPFLDPDLFDAMSTMPDKFLMSGGIGKLLLREMMKDRLPREVFDHPKQGFNIPLHSFQNDQFEALARELLFESKVGLELFNQKEIMRVLDSGLQAESNGETSVFQSTHKLWMLMQFLGWMKRFKVSC